MFGIGRMEMQLDEVGMGTGKSDDIATITYPTMWEKRILVNLESVNQMVR